MLKIISVFVFILKLYSIQVNAQATCSQNFCGTNGVCEIQNNVAVCVCKPGFVGAKCQLIDPCNVKPCGVNGACFPVVKSQNIPGQLNPVEQTSYHCQCYSGFFGDNCQNAPPKPCNSNPCLNNGICVNRNNSWDYHCICVGTYTGKNCGNFLDVCGNHHCLNDGLCIPLTDNHNYTCSCKNGFYGDRCQFEINECSVIVNGVETTPCLNDAKCYDLVDAYYCECTGPFVGQNCETSLLSGTGDDFNSLLLPVILPVVSAALLPILPTALTLALRNRAKDVNPCNNNPCGQGAICQPNGNSFVCQCAPGFFGSPCQPDPCVSNPCKKPGSKCIPVEAGALITSIPNCTCTNPDPTYVCVCPSTNPPYASTIC